MYKKKSPQITMFETPESFMLMAEMDTDNRWVKMAKLIPWDMVEKKYAKQFKNTPFSRPAKPARMAIGSLIIKEKFGLSDIETVEMIAENPYMQYFIGHESFSKKAPMEASLLTWFRKRISPEMLSEINDYIIGHKVLEEKRNDPPDDTPPTGGNTEESDAKNKGTLILDATCVPSDVRFPTDVSLLNEGREMFGANHRRVARAGINEQSKTQNLSASYAQRLSAICQESKAHQKTDTKCNQEAIRLYTP